MAERGPADGRPGNAPASTGRSKAGGRINFRWRQRRWQAEAYKAMTGEMIQTDGEDGEPIPSPKLHRRPAPHAMANDPGWRPWMCLIAGISVYVLA